MHKLVLLALATALTLAAQSAGTVDVQLTITATAGAVQCVVTPAAGGQSASVVCKKGTATVATVSQTPAVDAAGILVSVAAPISATVADAVTVLLKKTTATAPVAWEVSANGLLKSGTF